MYIALGFHVHRRGGVVEYEHRRTDGKGPGQRDPLFLPAGQADAPFPHDGVVAFRHPADEIVRIGHPGERARLLLGQAQIAENDVAFHRVGKKENVLGSGADIPAKLLEFPHPYVAAVHQDLAGVHVIKAGEQMNQRGFPRTRRPHNGEALPGFHSKADMIENPDLSE